MNRKGVKRTAATGAAAVPRSAMKHHNMPRKPTQEELDHLLGDCLVRLYDMQFPDIYEIQKLKEVISQASIAVFDQYRTENREYAGKLMMVVWNESPSCYQVFTWDKDKQIYPVEQDDLMSEKRGA
jgi:hypothetical protein